MFQAAQIALDARRKVRIDDGSRCPFILAEFGQNPMGCGDRHAKALQGRLNPLLGLRVCKREQQRDGHSLRSTGADFVHQDRKLCV